MIDLGGAILSFVEYLSTLVGPQLEPKPPQTPLQLIYKIAYCFVAAWSTQFILFGIFNLANHPLADFPGPRWAAFTAWYKTYRELFRGESWVFVLEELHKKYGTLIMINILNIV
jgi:hypothetical protein